MIEKIIVIILLIIFLFIIVCQTKKDYFRGGGGRGGGDVRSSGRGKDIGLWRFRGRGGGYGGYRDYSWPYYSTPYIIKDYLPEDACEKAAKGRYMRCILSGKTTPYCTRKADNLYEICKSEI